MKKLLYIPALLLLFISCIKDNNVVTPDVEVTPQTTLMYMTGTDLSYYFGLNITAAKTAITNNALGDGRFLVFKHSTSSVASLVEYKYENGACVEETLKTYSSITSLTQSAITEVVADVKTLAPATDYNLIISGHATGWVLQENNSDWSKAATTSKEAIDWEAMSTSPIITRYLGSSNDSYFDIQELKTSLEATNTKFGYIIFDECFMSSVEAIYDLRSTCDYIIASPCEIMGAGFPYDTVLPALFSNNGSEADLQAVCEAYYNYYSTYTYPSGCISMTVTSELDALAELIYEINSTYSDEDVDIDSLQAYERLNGHLFFDLEQYMLAKCGDATLADEFKAQMELAFPSECRLHTERFFANIGESVYNSTYEAIADNYDKYYTTLEYYSGVTTSAPSSRMTDNWAATAWAIATNQAE